jgi:N-acetylneuraminate synthase
MSIFDDLFVLELANNHLGRLDRGFKIIDDFAKVVRDNDVRAAIKLQFRDVGSFIHDGHRHREDSRYIKKVASTELSWDDLGKMVERVRAHGLVTMATPFDEISVDRCVEFGVEILKIASSDIRDRILIEKMASTGKPVIASSGGSNLDDVDHLVAFFAERGIPFALNHCVSLYPSTDAELEINQIDFLRGRFPKTVIGFSSHEMTDWSSSVMIAYAKGARTFERHVDIEMDGVPVSSYCTLPDQADTWFKAFKKAKEMCGAPGLVKRAAPEKEIRYLDELVRGVYAKRDLPAGHRLTIDDVYLAVPLLHGQISVREFVGGERLKAAMPKDAPVRLREIDAPYGNDLNLQRLVETRGIERGAPPVQDESLRQRVGAA